MNRRLVLSILIPSLLCAIGMALAAPVDVPPALRPSPEPGASNEEVGETQVGLENPRAAVAKQLYGLGAGDSLRLLSACELGITTRAVSGATDTMQIDIQGEVALLCLAANEREVALAVKMPVPSCGLLVGGRRSDSEQLARDLRAGFVVRLLRSGVVAGYRFQPDTDIRHRNVLRTWFASMRAPLAGDARATWQALEWGTAGETRLQLRRTDPSTGATGVTWERELVEAPAGVAATVQGSGRLLADAASGWWALAEAREQSHLEVREARLHIDGTFVASHRLLAYHLGAAGAGFDWGATWNSADGRDEVAAAQAFAEREHWAAMLCNTSLAVELDRLTSALANGDEDSAAVQEQRERLTWLLRLRPDLIDKVAALIEPAASSELLAATLAAVLGSEGSSRSQLALLSRIDQSSLPALFRVQCLRGFFHVDAPTDAVIAMAQRLSQQPGDPLLADTGLLLVGSFAQASRPGQASAAAFDSLVQQEPEAGDAARTEVWLHALANSGRNEVVPIAARYLQHEEPELRCAAVAAMRRVDASTSFALLSHRAAHDPSPAVRQMAVTTLVEQSDAGVRGVLTQALQDADELVREAAVLAMQLRDDLAACRTAVERASVEDPSCRVRERAAAALRSLDSRS